MFGANGVVHMHTKGSLTIIDDGGHTILSVCKSCCGVTCNLLVTISTQTSLKQTRSMIPMIRNFAQCHEHCNNTFPRCSNNTWSNIGRRRKCMRMGRSTFRRNDATNDNPRKRENELYTNVNELDADWSNDVCEIFLFAPSQIFDAWTVWPLERAACTTTDDAISVDRSTSLVAWRTIPRDKFLPLASDFRHHVQTAENISLLSATSRKSLRTYSPRMRYLYASTCAHS